MVLTLDFLNYGVLGGSILLAGFAVRYFRRERQYASLIDRLLTIAPMLIVSGLGFAFCFLSMAMTENSSSLYSPDRKHAVVVQEVHTLTDRTISVFLHSKYGFKRDLIYQGVWVFTSREDIRWVDSSKLVIGYRGSSAKSAPRICSGAAGVEVACEHIGVLGHPD